MKILVAVKRVVDPAVSLRVKPDGSGMETAQVRMSMNPFDEIAVEAAVRLKEAGVATEIVVVSCGLPAAQETLRTAMAMGADRSLLVETSVELSPLLVAKLLKAVCDHEQPELVICGKQAVDDDACQVGQRLAALAGWPQVVRVSELSVAGSVLSATCEIDGGREFLRMALPAVVTTELGLNAPRYATLPNLMKAKKKPVAVMTPSDLGVALVSQMTLLHVVEPSRQRAGVRVVDGAALANVIGEFRV